MAKSASGKWVSRVGASGGGKAYKKTRPGNFYGALAVIVVLGLVATVFARYDYQHPAKAAGGAAPQVGTTWYAALSIENCGTRLAYLTPDTTDKGAGLTVLPSNVIRISPISAADAGDNATLAQFANEYVGLVASSSQLKVPKGEGIANPKTSFTNGQTCAVGTKYAGQKGTITYAYWKYGAKKPTITTDPSTIKFAQDMSVAMAFDPVNVTPQKPRTQTIDAMFAAAQTVTTTTAGAPVATTTTLKGAATTTTVVNSTTTTKG